MPSKTILQGREIWRGQAFSFSLCAPGVGRYMSKFWYRKVFELPKHWEGSRVRLNFGAVDWQCQVFVNGQEMGVHIGGFDKASHVAQCYTSQDVSVTMSMSASGNRDNDHHDYIQQCYRFIVRAYIVPQSLLFCKIRLVLLHIL